MNTRLLLLIEYTVCSSHVTCYCMELTWLLIHMKYSRYTAYFIGLVHVFSLHTRSLYWLIDDNCIIDTLPDAYFACYRLAHDDGKCMNCMLQLLHRIVIDCFRFEFLFLLVLSSLPIWVSIRVHISLDFVVLIICCPLQIIAVFSTWTLTHMPVDMIKTCSFYNCQTCKQIIIIVLNNIPSF